MVPRSERPFSESIELVDFMAKPNSLRTLKRIRTFTTPASYVRPRHGEDWELTHLLGALE